MGVHAFPGGFPDDGLVLRANRALTSAGLLFSSRRIAPPAEPTLLWPKNSLEIANLTDPA
jgi:hypothetical protein